MKNDTLLQQTNCCELLVVINQTIRHINILRSHMSFRQIVCENNSLSVWKNALPAADCYCGMQCFNVDIIHQSLTDRRQLLKRENYLNRPTLKPNMKCCCWIIQITYNKFQHFLSTLSATIENFMIILWPCQMSMSIIYISIIMMSQHDVINETTISNVQ